MDRQTLARMLLEDTAPTPKPRLDLSQPPDQFARAGVMPQGEMRATDLSAGQNAAAAARPYVGDRVAPMVGGLVDYGQTPAQIAVELVKQPVRAGEAVGDAVMDPTIPKLTNAGVQTGAALMKPMAMGGSAAAGIAAALLADTDFGGDTQAKKAKAPSAPPAPDVPGLSEGEAVAFKAAWDQLYAPVGSIPKAARQSAQTTVDGIMARMGADAAKKADLDRQEYGRRVIEAEAIKDTELNRQRRFGDTVTGQVFNEMGGLAPLAMGMIPGAVGRLAKGPTDDAMNDAMLWGGLTGGASANMGLAYEVMNAPAYNPEKAAFTAYGRELPDGHPEKQKWMEYGAGLPDGNPVRDAASADLYDIPKLAERTGMGAVEGVLGGRVGAEGVQIGRRLIDKTKGVFGYGPKQQLADEVLDGTSPVGPGATPPPTNLTSVPYKKLPQDVRGVIQDEYVAGRAVSGGANMDPKPAAPLIKQALEKLGYSVPVTPARVKETNDAVAAFVQRERRQPVSKSDWASVFNDKTLALPFAAGGAAYGLSDQDRIRILAEQLMMEQ